MIKNCNKCIGELNIQVDQFTFSDLQNAAPPDKKGVYIIRVKKRGAAPTQVFSDLYKVYEQINWKLVSKYVFSRLNRLNQIHECDIIYIGRAGSSKKEKSNTLKGRYKELANRHTIQFPLWLLLFLGWELEYGWRENLDPDKLETKLKDLYKGCHEGKLPALVNR